jgi:hypothetical protein
MANTINKFQDPRQFLIPMYEEHFHKNRRSVIDYYGEDYMDKLLNLTGGRVPHDYDRHVAHFIKSTADSEIDNCKLTP